MSIGRTPSGPSVGIRRVPIIQGEHAVSTDPAVVMSTVLGSCVAACVYDDVRGLGGMNHFLLAESANGSRIADEAMRYGAYAMEVLINDLMKLGAGRAALKCKLFGGAKMFDSLNDIGRSNAIFARSFMADEGIEIVGESLGGRQARRIEFWPTTGRVRQREVDKASEAEVAPAQPAKPAVDGGVELF